MIPTLYDTDFYAWTLRQAELLKHEDFAEIDLQNLIEEIEGMARSDRRALENRLRVLLVHLLKLSCMPDGNPSRGWRATVTEQRMRISRILSQNPSMTTLLPGAMSDVYAEARIKAGGEPEMANADFPVHCPWTPDQILNLEWLP